MEILGFVLDALGTLIVAIVGGAALGVIILLGFIGSTAHVCGRWLEGVLERIAGHR
jgi:hypothetical protein